MFLFFFLSELTISCQKVVRVKSNRFKSKRLIVAQIREHLASVEHSLITFNPFGNKYWNMFLLFKKKKKNNEYEGV